MKEIKTEKITFRTSAALRRRLEALAFNQDRTVSYLINSIIQSYFKSRPELAESPAQSRLTKLDWIKYGFGSNETDTAKLNEFLESVRNIMLYSSKAAQDLMVVGYSEDDQSQVILINTNQEVMALDSLAQNFSDYFLGQNQRLPRSIKKLKLYYGSDARFAELRQAAKSV